MITLKISSDWTNNIPVKKEEKIVIDNKQLENSLRKLWLFSQEEGDDFTLGELFEILISEGCETVIAQING